MIPPVRFLLSLPGDVLGGLRVLPQLARDIASVAEATRTLPGILDALNRMSEDTRSIPVVRDDMARVREDMDGVAESTSVLVGMDGRMAAIESAMPVLVEVRQHLQQLPETIGGLDKGVEAMGHNLERLLVSLEELSASLTRLEGSVGPLGRLAGRFPGGRRGRDDAEPESSPDAEPADGNSGA